MRGWASRPIHPSPTPIRHARPKFSDPVCLIGEEAGRGACPWRQGDARLLPLARCRFPAAASPLLPRSFSSLPRPALTSTSSLPLSPLSGERHDWCYGSAGNQGSEEAKANAKCK